MSRWYEFKQANNFCKAFYFFDGFFFIILFAGILVQMTFYGLKYVEDPTMITDECHPLPPDVHGFRGYQYEWNAFIGTLIYFQAMTFTVWNDPIESDIITDIKYKILIILKIKSEKADETKTYFDITDRVETQLKQVFKAASKAIEDRLLQIDRSKSSIHSSRVLYLSCIQTLMDHYGNMNFAVIANKENKEDEEDEEVLTESDDDISDSAESSYTDYEYPHVYDSDHHLYDDNSLVNGYFE